MGELVGKRIKERRKELHMKQETLAERCNLSRARISALENNKCNDILLSTIATVADVLGTTVDYFFDRSGQSS